MSTTSQEPTANAPVATIRIGCSGWQYPHWRGAFYPPDLPQRQWLGYYARHFDTVEVNNTFYRLPPESVVQGWRESVPSGFVFAVKASRYLTHLKRLLNPVPALTLLLDRVSALGPHLGPVLYQLPPRWRCNVDRLHRFLEVLPSHLSHAVEFRDPSWYTEDVFQLLAQYGVALSVHDLPGSASPRVAVAPLVYVRLHGTSGRYQGAYSPAALRSWADWLTREARAGRRAWVYFNNDVAAQAPRDAARLKRLVARRGG